MQEKPRQNSRFGVEENSCPVSTPFQSSYGGLLRLLTISLLAAPLFAQMPGQTANMPVAMPVAAAQALGPNGPGKASHWSGSIGATWPVIE
jgi:hypothetical protein